MIRISHYEKQLKILILRRSCATIQRHSSPPPLAMYDHLPFHPLQHTRSHSAATRSPSPNIRILLVSLELTKARPLQNLQNPCPSFLLGMVHLALPAFCSGHSSAPGSICSAGITEGNWAKRSPAVAMGQRGECVLLGRV